MDERTILIASFGLGVVVQAALLVRNDWSWLKLAGCVALGLVGFVPGKHEHVYEPLFHVLLVFSTFSVAFAFMFMKDILPLITEAVLLSYTLVFWFAFFSYFYSGTPLQIALVVLLLAPTLATLLICLQKTQPGFVLKLILYSWFLVIVVCLGLFQFPFSQLKLFFKREQVPWVTPTESIAAGMAFLFLLANATYVFYLIPIRGRNQSWADRMREWHRFTDLITQRVANAQITLAQSIIVLGVEGTALLLNSIYRWLPAGLVINVAILLPSIVLHPKLSPIVGLGSEPASDVPAERIPDSRHLLKEKSRDRSTP